MGKLSCLRSLPCLVLASASISANAVRAAWPNGPFATSGRWMVDASGANVTYAGVNWPGAVDTMIPEGLQYQSIETIVSKIKSLGMNAIRLTYAIEMIDQIYENTGNDVPIQTAFVSVLGQENGTAIYNQVIANNPSFNESTTRLQVYDEIAAECAKQEIYVHLDNHVSQATWCCSPYDGNSWWGDTYFSATNWTRGLAYMANHGKSWSNLMSMSLRNELRQPLDNVTLYNQTYNWETWYSYVKRGVSAINTANPDVLVFLSGLNSDTDLSNAVQGTALTPGTGTFSISDFPSKKIVLELHNYENTATNCSLLESDLYIDGFESLTSSAANEFPMVLTEFGFAQDGTTWKGVYASCLESYLPSQNAGWMIWVLAGSYYIRQGIQDYDETWGLLDHNWSDWRDPAHIDGGLIPMINASLADTVQSNQSTGSSPGSSPGGSSKNLGSQPGLMAEWLAISFLVGVLVVL